MKVTKRQLEKLVESIVKEQIEESSASKKKFVAPKPVDVVYSLRFETGGEGSKLQIDSLYKTEEGAYAARAQAEMHIPYVRWFVTKEKVFP